MSNRPDYDVGDLVVCVDDRRAPQLTRTCVYTVLGFNDDKGYSWLDNQVCIGVFLVEANPNPGDVGFDSRRFRRIDPKPPEFWTGEVEADQRDKAPA